MTSRVRAGILLFSLLYLSIPARADTLGSNATVLTVYAGNSSAGQDQIWFKVSGQPSGVPSDCMSAGNALFFIPNDGNISQDHAEALLLTAKATGSPVQIIFMFNLLLPICGYSVRRNAP